MTESPFPGPDPAPGDPQTPGPPAPSVTDAIPPKCPTRTRMYRNGELAGEGFPPDKLSEQRRDGWT
jgi:magnesium transporter